MVYKGTTIYICDNTGIRTMKVLQTPESLSARVGDVLLGVIRKKRKLKPYVKKKLYSTFLVSSRSIVFRKRGFYYCRLLRNQGIVLNVDQGRILGTRHVGFLTLESRRRAFTQLVKTTRILI